MKTCFKLSIRYIQKSVFLREVIVFMFVVLFAFVIFFVSAVKIKLKDYQSVSRFFKQNGVLITSMGLSKSAEDGGFLIRDEEELAEYIGDTADILCMEEVWATTANGETVYTYCYGRNVTDSLDPLMKEGRWFNKQDKSSNTLKVVVSFNNGVFKTGDRIVLKSTLIDDIEQELEVIGVLEDDQLMFMGDTLRTPYCDYRDCFRIISSKHEPVIKLFLSDEQLSGGAFPYLNFRTGPDKGFQKQMRNVTLIGFNDSISGREINDKLDRIRRLSQIVGYNTLDDVRKGSIKYITEEIRMWMPLFIMVTVFVFISLISINIVMTQKMIGYYAIHYLCGFTWMQNAIVTLLATEIEAVAAMVIIMIIALSGKTIIAIGISELIACIIAVFILSLIAYVSVLIQLHKRRVKEVFSENARRRLTW